MIIYEVNIEIEPEIYQEYKDWVGPHAEEVVSHKGFEKVTIFEVKDTLKPIFVSHYYVKSQEDLEHYLKTAAPQLRAEAEKKFGEKIKGFRRVLCA